MRLPTPSTSQRTITRCYRVGAHPDELAAVLMAPRRDILDERQTASGSGATLGVVGDEQAGSAPCGADDVGPHRSEPSCGARFVQAYGPFVHYERTVELHDGHWTERTDYRFRAVPFGWLIGVGVRHQLGRRGGARIDRGPATRPWWSPPDVLNRRQLSLLCLLVAASVSTAYMNTVFSQTATFAADAFGADDAALGLGGAVVRLGVIISVPLGLIADRVGRRPVLTAAAIAAPILCGLGALAPNFWVLVATQAAGRPLAITCDMLLAIIAAEEMPRNSRAYAVAVMAMAYGLGAGLVVAGLALAGLGPGWWRADYAAALAWLAVAAAIANALPESRRFVLSRQRHTVLDRRRLLLVAGTVIAGNAFVAPASFFLNRYLSDVRGLSPATLAAFSLSVGTPAGLGLVLGGRLADTRGRRRVIVWAVPASTALVLVSFGVGGGPMWLATMLGGLAGGIAVPALLVYRSELFPTGRRSIAAGLLNVGALVAGSVSIAWVGRAVEQGWSFATALGVCSVGQIVVVCIVGWGFPESASRGLEELNPGDVRFDGRAIEIPPPS